MLTRRGRCLTAVLAATALLGSGCAPGEEATDPTTDVTADQAQTDDPAIGPDQQEGADAGGGAGFEGTPTP